MDAAYPALIAVAGTLLGAIAAHYFQLRQMDRSDTANSIERLRQERIDVYGRFAEAVAELRGSQLQRWLARHRNNETSEVYLMAKTTAWERRTIARGLMYRVQLLADDESVSTAAAKVLETTIDILCATDQSELQLRAKASAETTEEFVCVAATQLAKMTKEDRYRPRVSRS